MSDEPETVDLMSTDHEYNERQTSWHIGQIERLTNFCCHSSGLDSPGERFKLKSFKLNHADWLERFGPPDFEFSLYEFGEYLQEFAKTQPTFDPLDQPRISYFFENDELPEIIRRHRVFSESSFYFAREIFRIYGGIFGWNAGYMKFRSPEEELLRAYCGGLLGESPTKLKCPDLQFFDCIKFTASEEKESIRTGRLFYDAKYNPYIPMRFAVMPGASSGILANVVDGINRDSYVENGYFFATPELDGLMEFQEWPDGLAVIADDVRITSTADVKGFAGPIFVFAKKLSIEAGALPSADTIFVHEGCEIDDRTGGLVAIKFFRRGGPLPRPMLRLLLDSLEQEFRMGSTQKGDLLLRCNELASTEPTSVISVLAFVNAKTGNDFADWELEDYRHGGSWYGKAAEFLRLAELYGKLLANEDFFGNALGSVPVSISDDLMSRVNLSLERYKEYSLIQDNVVKEILATDERKRRLGHELDSLEKHEEPILKEKLAARTQEVDLIFDVVSDIERQIEEMKSIELLHGISAGLIRLIDAHIWRFKDPIDQAEQLEFLNIEIEKHNRKIEKALRSVSNEIAQRNAAISLLDLLARLKREMARHGRAAAELTTTKIEIRQLESRKEWLKREISSGSFTLQPPAKFSQIRNYYSDRISQSLIELRRALAYDYKIADENEYFDRRVHAPDPAGFELIVRRVDDKRNELFESLGRRGSPKDFRNEYEKSFLYIQFSDANDARYSTNFVNLHWGSFLDTGEISLSIGHAASHGSSSFIDIPENFSNVEIETVDVWLKPKGVEFDTSVVDPQFEIIHGVNETNVNFQTGDVVEFGLSRFDLQRVLHARSQASLKHGTNFDNPSADWVYENLANQDTRYFVGLSPITSWRLKFFEPDGVTMSELLKEIDKVAFVIPYIFASRT